MLPPEPIQKESASHHVCVKSSTFQARAAFVILDSADDVIRVEIRNFQIFEFLKMVIFAIVK